MTPNYERLEKIEQHLRSGVLLHNEFDFSTVHQPGDGGEVGGCGSLGCAMGEFPRIFVDDWKFNAQDLLECATIQLDPDGVDDVAEYLGISVEAAIHLFIPYDQDPLKFGGDELGADATRVEVADNIRTFINMMKAA